MRSSTSLARRLACAIAIPALAMMFAPVVNALGAQQRAAPAAASAASINIDWRVLSGLDYVTGAMTDTLKKLDGKKVRVPGFIVPLDDADQEGAEFLLVPYYGACVHTPPPPPNQMAFVQMLNKKSVKLGLFDAVWMEGTLRITNYDSPYGQVGFQLEGLTMKPYTGK